MRWLVSSVTDPSGSFAAPQCHDVTCLCATVCFTAPPFCPCFTPADQIGDLGVAAAERDDDDDYNPEEDSSDSEGGRRGRKARLAKLQQQQAAVTSAPQGMQQQLGDPRGKKGRGAAGRGRGAGLSWSAGGRGGRGGPGGPGVGLAPPSGVAWTREQVAQQLQMHLNQLQKAMLDAAATGNTAVLAQLAAGAQKLPTPLPLVRRQQVRALVVAQPSAFLDSCCFRTLADQPSQQSPLATDTVAPKASLLGLPLASSVQLCALHGVSSVLQDVLAGFNAGLEFLLIVAAYNNSKKPGFVPPIVGDREMDMYIVSPWLCQLTKAAEL